MKFQCSHVSNPCKVSHCTQIDPAPQKPHPLFLLLSILFAFTLSACQPQQTVLNQLTDSAILYLGWDDNDIIQLFAVTQNEDPIQISSVTESIQNFAISPNKEVAFVTKNALFWLSPTQSVTSIFECIETACDGLFWDNGGLLGFRYANDMLWIDAGSGETKSIFSGEKVDGKNGRLSPDGHWLSFIDSEQETLALVNRTTGEIFAMFGGTNTNASWHPDGLQLITTELTTFQEALSPHITRINTISQNSVDLSTTPGFQFVADNWPSYSPDGSTIAFIRKIPTTNTGGQLWLMNGDGHNQHALTDDPAYAFGPPYWSKDQSQLLSQQASITNPTKRPSIILFDTGLNTIEQIAKEGFMPQWFVQ